MPSRAVHFVNGSYYHIFNRGVEQRDIFLQTGDYERFLGVLKYYRKHRSIRYSLWNPSDDKELGPNKLEILCCLMPNHFHLLLKQKEENGISNVLRLLQDSYTRYFNIKYHRIGPLLQGAFKAVHISSDEQLLHVSRYIHLNPFVANLVSDPSDYKWSSYQLYGQANEITSSQDILSFFKSTQAYREFINDHANYAKSLAAIKHEILDF